MVFLTQSLCYVKRKFTRRGILDALRVYVRAGSGGAGLPQYGGTGGAGGNVYIVSKEGLTLQGVKSKIQNTRLCAGHGGNSTAKGIIGTRGQDLTINVPTGITAYNQCGISLGEVNQEGSKIMIAKGGIGGCQETGFCGQKGEAGPILLDLKVIADVGVVGFPNAGKSTFLHAISRAKPKIASYPFTTIRPNLGRILYKDLREITVADLPGLIEGAHLNIGMGHNFLKHLERTKLLLFIVDVQGFQLSVKDIHRTCLETVFLLNKEIELYKPALLEKPAMLIVNKMDTENANEIYAEIGPKLKKLSDFTMECPKEMIPENIIKFENIMTASLIQKNKKELLAIKETIRALLDAWEEKNQFPDELSVDKELYEKLKRKTKQEAPTLL